MLDHLSPPAHPVTFLAAQSRSVGDMFLKQVARSGSAMAWQSKHGGTWQRTSWQEFGERAMAVATYLITTGVTAADKITIIGSTRPEWAISDIGGLLSGAVTVGAYPTLSAPQLAYILGHSDTKVAIVEGRNELAKLRQIQAEVPTLQLVLVWDTSNLDDLMGNDGWVKPFTEALATPIDRPAIDARLEAIDPASTAIIVYTSGTTGPPKGAMISHRNILTLLSGQQDVMPLSQDDHGLSFLPMAHVAERVLAFYGRISNGTSTTYASSITAVLDEVQEVQPTVFGSVPRIFEKAYAKIMAQVSELTGVKRTLFTWAERVGRDVVRRWQAGETIPLGLNIQYRIADKLIFSKLRGVFGGRVKYFVTGAAPIAYEILEFFWAAGFRIYEVYGMTEATVVTHANRPGSVRLGSVGKKLSYVDCKLADDGEILIRGPVVFQGYYKDPAATAEAIDAEGWLHTGDIGKFDDDGYLYIVDRKKHIIITAGGKNLTPANIENEIKSQDPLISQVHVHGDRRAYLTAIVTIGPTDAIEWARKRGIVDDATAASLVEELTNNPLARPEALAPLMAKVTAAEEIRNRVRAAVERANANLSRVETVKKVYLLDREFSAEEDELTPTLKLKRKNVEQKFAAVFDKLYSDPTFGIVVQEK